MWRAEQQVASLRGAHVSYRGPTKQIKKNTTVRTTTSQKNAAASAMSIDTAPQLQQVSVKFMNVSSQDAGFKV